MAVGFIANAKELAVSYKPLLLAEITFPSGTTLYLASSQLNATAEGGGGFAYGGNDYLPRLANQDVALTQALSDQGVDLTPSVTLQIADPDSTIWNNFELVSGFKGATMLLRFIFWNADQNDFSTDSTVKFVGICQQASCDEKFTTVTAVSKMNMVNTPLPPQRIQPTCPHFFPGTLAQRQDGADHNDSPYFECGYSPDGTGGNIVGNIQDMKTLSSGITSGATSLTMSSASSVPTPFPFTIDNETFIANSAIGAIYQISRGAQNTTAASHSGGATIRIPYSVCNKTRGNCMLRLGNAATTSVAPDGDLQHDIAGRPTGRFGGIQYQPQGTILSRGYISGNWEQIINNSNQAKYGDLVPMAYGPTWVSALVLNTNGDANYTTMEVLLCSGQIPFIYKVVINGIEVPSAGVSSMGIPNALPNGNNLAGGAWFLVNDGGRNGAMNALQPYNKHGDPYGSLAVITIVVPVQVAAANSTPSVQVWFDGPMLRLYTTPTTFTMVRTSNLSWVILDVLFWAAWRATDIDIQSFIDYAALCDTQIFFTNNAGQLSNLILDSKLGGYVPYRMYDVSLTLRQRTSAADVLRGLRNAGKAVLVPNYDTGKLHIFAKQTLASQQAAQVQLNGQVATNDATAYSSTKIDGTAGTGYSAYTFDESNILKQQGSDASTFRILPRTIGDSPNELQVGFENLENQCNSDGITIIDTEDTGRIQGQQIQGSIPLVGANTFDRVQRATNTWMAENLRGNPRNSQFGATIGDTGGSYKIEFETSFRAIHLKVGDIVLVSYQQRGLDKDGFRVTGIQPGSDATRLKLTLAWHNDGWYLTSYGQTNAPLYRHPQGFDNRPPMSWCPGAEAPVAGDSMFRASDKSFQLSQQYLIGGDNTAIARCVVAGRVPVNNAGPSPQPPLMALQGSTVTTGGTIPGGQTYYIGVAAKDVTGAGYKPSYLSNIIARVFIPAGTNTNTLTVTVAYWDLAAKGYIVFAGTDPNRLSYQKDADTTPATITLTSYNQCSWPAPDALFDHLRVYNKRCLHTGIADVQVVSCTSTTIVLATLVNNGFATNALAGYDVSLAGLVTASGTNVPNQDPLPIWNAKILSNTANTITLTAGIDGTTPDPTAVVRGDGTVGLVVDDWLCIRSLPVAGSDGGGNYIEDALWVNPLNPLFDPFSISAITNANPGVVTTSSANDFVTGDKVYLDQVGGMSTFPRLVTVTVIDSTHFSIAVNTTGLGAYTSGGIASKQDQGLTPDVEVGNFIRCISGTGRGQKALIKSNGANRIYITGAWPGITPDATTRYIVEESSWAAQPETPSLSNSDYTQSVQLGFNINNYKNEAVVIMVATEDPNDNEALEFNSPVRDFLVLGQPGTFNPNDAGFVTLTITANAVTQDLSLGVNFQVTLNQATQITVNNPIWSGGTLSFGQSMSLYVLTDATSGRPTPAFGTAFGADVMAQVIDGTASRRSAYNVTYHADGFWHLDSFITGQIL